MEGQHNKGVRGSVVSGPGMGSGVLSNWAWLFDGVVSVRPVVFFDWIKERCFVCFCGGGSAVWCFFFLVGKRCLVVLFVSSKNILRVFSHWAGERRSCFFLPRERHFFGCVGCWKNVRFVFVFDRRGGVCFECLFLFWWEATFRLCLPNQASRRTKFVCDVLVHVLIPGATGRPESICRENTQNTCCLLRRSHESEVKKPRIRGVGERVALTPSERGVFTKSTPPHKKLPLRDSTGLD